MSDMVAQAKGIIKYQTELGNNLSSLRSKEMNARIAFERGKEELAKITRNKTIELSNLPHINTPDPKTGRPNQEWAKMLLDKELEEDEEFRKALVAILPGIGLSPRVTAMYDCFQLGLAKREAFVKVQHRGEWKSVARIGVLLEDAMGGDVGKFAVFEEVLGEQSATPG